MLIKELAEFLKEIRYNGLNLLRWYFLATLTGLTVGGVSVAFHTLDRMADTFRSEHFYILLGLPLAGIVIAFLYRKAGVHNARGTNLVITTVQAKSELSVLMAPLIFVSTVLTHLFGGSVGREGAALQLGSSLSAGLGRIKALKLSDADRRLVIMCGMSAAFSAIFGTPIAAVFFPIEVISIGIIQYSALFPCFTASLTAYFVAHFFGVEKESLGSVAGMELSPLPLFQVAMLAVLCGIVSILFCLVLKYSGSFFKKLHKSAYVRAVIGGLLFVGINLLLGTTDYLGAGMPVIERATESGALPYAFLLKMILTAICIGAGYKGGEIVPSLFIGATLGSAFASTVGLPVSVGAACGMAALFAGVTNCPVSSFLIIVELFGFREAGIYFLLAVTVSYVVSGYFGLYSAQTIVYSKFHTKFINRKVGAYDPDLEEK